jgi:predicted phosphodiesterase
MYGGALISSSEGTPDDWTDDVRQAAQNALQSLNRHERSLFLPIDLIQEHLEQLRPFFTDYNLYALILPDPDRPRQEEDSFRFFYEAGRSSGSNALILMPRFDHGRRYSEVLDPFPALRTLAESSLRAPLTVFWTRHEQACVLPEREAIPFYRHALLPALVADDIDHVEHLVDEVRRRSWSSKILHLSDPHFGTAATSRRSTWVKQHIQDQARSMDRVVISGDLFDSPGERARDAFDEFRLDIERQARNEIIVVPGNHDVRRKGNAAWSFGRNAEYVTDLGWSQIVVDDTLSTIFLCFNSSESGNFAKGAVSDRQRLRVGTLLDRQLARNPESRSYRRIAVVHHHPVCYETQPTALYEQLLRSVFGTDEHFVAFENSEEFLRWCAARDVSLVLHGHKHVPHLTQVIIEMPDGDRRIDIVGCGSITGADNTPMCYDVIILSEDRSSQNILFYHDKYSDGGGFALQSVALDLRPKRIRW